MEAIYPASPSVSYLASQAQGWRVLDLDQHFESTHERQVAALGILSPPRRPIIAACSPFGYGAPLANMFRIEALRGFNPIDVRRYKEYLQLMTDRDEPIRPLDENCPFGFPSIGNFRPVNWRLADVLGVRYLLVGQGEYRSDGDPRWQKVLWDSDPMAYTIAEGGVVPLDGFTVYRSDSTLPRAFVVGEAELLPEGSEVLEKLRTTDFRKTVLLESNEAPSNDGDYREASVIESQPNRVRIHVPDGPAGYLVLADVWYPGWHATVDGREVPCLRGDYLFRTVALSKGAHEVEFTFWPESYARGRWISGAALLILIMSMLMALFLTGWHALSLRRACSTVRDCMPRPSQTQGVPPIMAAPASSANV
jgi:hypothetical protein